VVGTPHEPTTWLMSVPAGAKFVAPEENATKRPSALSAGPSEKLPRRLL
jgi:hypothetical protein